MYSGGRPAKDVRSTIAAGQLSYRAVDVRLAPQHGGTIVEEVEIVRVITFLLHDLELDVLVVQAGIQPWFSSSLGQVELEWDSGQWSI